MLTLTRPNGLVLWGCTPVLSHRLKLTANRTYLWNISRTFANKKISIAWLTKDNY